MLFRSCAGGVVFNGGSVLLLKNEKGEWVLPKGLIRTGMGAKETAVARVRTEGGSEAEIISMAGQTSYEFYSQTRQKPVCNEVTWFVMHTDSCGCAPNVAEGFSECGFFAVEEAVERITYSQDKALVKSAWDKYKKARGIKDVQKSGPRVK